MISIFKKIRQKLIMKNQTGKYLRYAIGEIALVMIGILLALQVNNWNEKRISKTNEINTLLQLNSDLKTNLIELTDLKSFIKNRADAGPKILHHFKTSNKSTDSLRLWIEEFSGGNIFNNANTTYKNIENNENNIISNDSLRLKITLIYETEFANVHRREAMFNNRQRPVYKAQLFEHFKIGPTMLNIGNQLACNTPKNYKALIKDDDFKTALVDAYNFRLLRIRWLTRTIENLEKLIRDIELEVKKL